MRRNVRQGETVVLLVDDDPTILGLFENGLEQSGFRVSSAQSAADAVRKAKDLGRIDVLATDLILADPLRSHTNPLRLARHGLDLTRRMFELHPNLKVVLFSGHSDDKVTEMGGIPEGAVFLRKPFTADVLAKTIRRLLEKPIHVRTIQIKVPSRKTRVWKLP